MHTKCHASFFPGEYIIWCLLVRCYHSLRHNFSTVAKQVANGIFLVEKKWKKKNKNNNKMFYEFGWFINKIFICKVCTCDNYRFMVKLSCRWIEAKSETIKWKWGMRANDSIVSMEFCLRCWLIALSPLLIVQYRSAADSKNSFQPMFCVCVCVYSTKMKLHERIAFGVSFSILHWLVYAWPEPLKQF